MSYHFSLIFSSPSSRPTHIFSLRIRSRHFEGLFLFLLMNKKKIDFNDLKGILNKKCKNVNKVSRMASNLVDQTFFSSAIYRPVTLPFWLLAFSATASANKT